jgi:DNA primase
VPKYLNSPESPIYHKGRMLYGLGWSRGAIRKAEVALVVEGYMDYVSLAAHGVENAVAPLGTAMTEDQAELLAKYAPRVILLYDSDKAGLKATFRAGDELLRAGAEVLVASLPHGEDPDSLVRGKGAKFLQMYLDDAVDVLERKIQILERKGFFTSIKGTRQAIDSLLPTVRATSDELLRGVYVNRIAELTGVSRETLAREVAEAPARDQRGVVSDGRRRTQPGRRAEDYGQQPSAPPAAAPRLTPMLGPERNLLLLLFRDESWVERAARELGPGDFQNPIYRSIYEGLLQAEGNRDPDGAWLELFPPEAQKTVEELRGDPEGQHMAAPEAYFAASVRQILSRPYEERLRAIDRELMQAQGEREVTLYKEKNDILTLMRERRLYMKHGIMHLLTTRERRNDDR